ncbi:MAG: hypothetical protein L0L14_01760 [Tetragenococcus koreensis]|nr:hypothetical protein [Tetragenococcus koreensis]
MPINESQEFLNAFKGFENYYILIGGTATSIVLAEYELESRSTKDYDMVIMDSKKDQGFYKAVMRFLEEGDYTPNVLGGKGKLYRFTTHKNGYPKMLELFSNKPYWLKDEYRTAPVHFDEDMSLSALLLDKDYYNLLEIGREIRKGYSVLNNKYLIVFKAKAWLDLSRKKKSGERIDSKNIKKHLNDIARLTGSLQDLEIEIPESIRKDMDGFLEELKNDLNIIPQNDDIVLDQNNIYEVLSSLLK